MKRFVVMGRTGELGEMIRLMFFDQDDPFEDLRVDKTKFSIIYRDDKPDFLAIKASEEEPFILVDPEWLEKASIEVLSEL